MVKQHRGGGKGAITGHVSLSFLSPKAMSNSPMYSRQGSIRDLEHGRAPMRSLPDGASKDGSVKTVIVHGISCTRGRESGTGSEP